VLAGLRLDGLIGGDDQQHKIDSADSGQHVAYEALVAGDVDESDLERTAIGHRQGHVGKTQIDSDAAPLLFLQPVRVDPRKSLDQRGFTVIDVPSRADNEGFHVKES